MIASTVKPPLATLETAIKAKDATAFTKANADLTAARNACHQSDHPIIVIQIPTTSPSPTKISTRKNEFHDRGTSCDATKTALPETISGGQ